MDKKQKRIIEVLDKSIDIAFAVGGILVVLYLSHRGHLGLFTRYDVLVFLGLLLLYVHFAYAFSWNATGRRIVRRYSFDEFKVRFVKTYWETWPLLVFAFLFFGALRGGNVVPKSNFGILFCVAGLACVTIQVKMNLSRLRFHEHTSVFAVINAVFLFIMGFAMLYAKYGLFDAQHQAVSDLHSCLYFSVMTFTTVGYGDLLPSEGSSKAFACAEALLGYFMLGLLLALIIQLLSAPKGDVSQTGD